MIDAVADQHPHLGTWYVLARLVLHREPAIAQHTQQPVGCRGGQMCCFGDFARGRARIERDFRQDVEDPVRALRSRDLHNVVSISILWM